MTDQVTGAGRLWVVLGVAALWLMAFALFFPTVVTISDEAAYVRQAKALAEGRVLVERDDVFSGAREAGRVSEYPPGTSLLMAPLMAMFGWRAAFLPGALALCAATLALAQWLRALGRDPLFALLLPAFVPALVIARCGMSDLPSAAFVVLSLWLFWRANGRASRMFAAGLLAGLSWLLRETNVMILAPFFAGALLRRERGVAWLVVGGLLGVAARVLATWLVFGEFWHVNPQYPGFSVGAVVRNAPLYLVALTLLVPGGLIFVALYRGERRLELGLAVAAFVLLHCFYDYNAAASGGLKQWILAPRFFIPLVPLLAFAAAEAVPRSWARFKEWLSVGARTGAANLARHAPLAAATMTAALAVMVNWYHAKWSDGQARLAQALYAATDERQPVLTNLDATGKFFNELYEREFGARLVGDVALLDETRLAAMLSRHEVVQVALLVRGDSEYWEEAARKNQAKLDALGPRFALRRPVVAYPAGSGERVEVYEITSAR